MVAHLVGLQRGIPVLFLLYTIFPNPLRLSVDTLHAPIVQPEEVRELSEAERDEVEAFRRTFTERAKPIREYRRWPVERRRASLFADHVRRKRGEDTDNEYLRPWHLLGANLAETLRARAARPFYDDLESVRPFVYFPLHVTDDYKIRKVIPHTEDQASLVEQVADALPPGHDLVLKEHPMSVGRNSIALLRRLRTRPNVRLVAPQTSSHELIRKAEAIAVISSTVGLEALLYEKPVLTLGQPFYSGYGVTLDVDSFRETPGEGAGAPAVPAGRGDDRALPARGDAAVRSGRARPRRPVGRERGAARRLARGGRDGRARRARGSGRARMKALFWDIDGTLLTTARAGVFSLEAALEEVSGVRTSLQGMATAGLTDYSIAEAALLRVGHSTDEATVQRFLRIHGEQLPEYLHRRVGEVLPGVREVLEDLDGRADVVNLLLTGNIEAGAAAKLAHYGLDGFFGHGGAFSVGPGERAEIARRALPLAKGAEAYVIGDTPADIACGLAIEARTIAVATGSYSLEALAEHEPWLLLERLPEPARFRALLGL